MQVADIMTREPACVRPDSTIQEAAEKMKQLDVGLLPVIVDDKPVGIVTDRDIVIRAVAMGSNPMFTKVGEAMTEEMACCFEDQSVDAAADLMQQKQIRRVLVLSREQRLVGVVSLGDLAVKASATPVAETLERISEPAEPRREALSYNLRQGE